MKTVTDLKDVPAGTAMTILQADGTYLCVSKIERPDVVAVPGPPEATAEEKLKELMEFKAAVLLKNPDLVINPTPTK